VSAPSGDGFHVNRSARLGSGESIRPAGVVVSDVDEGPDVVGTLVQTWGSHITKAMTVIAAKNHVNGPRPRPPHMYTASGRTGTADRTSRIGHLKATDDPRVRVKAACRLAGSAPTRFASI
jgi:hypothetical protein